MSQNSVTIARRPNQFSYLAEKRRSDTLALVKARRWGAALYMAGYILECALKAVISKLGNGSLPSEMFTHDLSLLRQKLLPHIATEHLPALQAIPNWSHLQRYDCAEPQASTVLAFINRVDEAHRCLRTYLQ